MDGHHLHSPQDTRMTGACGVGASLLIWDVAGTRCAWFCARVVWLCACGTTAVASLDTVACARAALRPSRMQRAAALYDARLRGLPARLPRTISRRLSASSATYSWHWRCGAHTPADPLFSRYQRHFILPQRWILG